MSALVPAFAQAVLAHREAASHLEAAYQHNPTEQQLARLSTRLNAQRQSLSALATRLEAVDPGLQGVTPSDSADLPTAITRAELSLQTADEAIRTVRRQAIAPLLPGVSPAVRAMLVYGGWSLAGWLVQCGLLTLTNGTDARTLLVSLCGIPVAVFAAALFTLEALGQPKAGARNKYSLKLGVGICLLGTPLAWAALLAVLAIFR